MKQQDLFCNYPDVVDIKQMCEMLGKISTKTGYRLLAGKQIQSIRIGRHYRIPKCSIISFVCEDSSKILQP